MVICRVYAKTQGHFHDCFEVILENLTKGGDDSHTQLISATKLSDYRLTAIYETITKVLIELISKLLGADKEFVKENLKKTFKSRYHFYTKIYFWEILLNCLLRCMIFRSSHRRCYLKKGVLKKFAIFTGNTRVGVSF